MTKYSIFHAFVFSFFSRDFYQDVAQNWRGIAAGYLLLLLAIVCIPTAFFSSQLLNILVKQEAPAWVQQIPTITVANGQLSIDKPTPYFIRNPKNQEVVIAIDTTGKITDIHQTTASALLMKDQIVVRKNQDQVQVYPLAKGSNYVVTPTKVNRLLELAGYWVPVFVYLVIVLTAFVFRLIIGLLFALLGFIYSRLLNADLSYHTIYRLTIIAFTPEIILKSILSYIPIGFPFQTFVFVLISLLYVVFAVRSAAVIAPLTKPL